MCVVPCGCSKTVAIPILGIVENMSYFIAPDTGNRYDIFGQGGGERLAGMYQVPFLGAIPLGISVREGATPVDRW